MATIPTAPQALSGSTGVGFGARSLFARPAAHPESGLGFGALQLDSSGLVGLGQGTSLGGSVSVAAAAIGTLAPPETLALNDDAIAVTATVSIGHDFSFHRHFGLTLAGDVGASFVSFFEAGGTSFKSLLALPALVAGASFFGTFKYVRPWLGATVGTAPISGAVSLQPAFCRLTCSPEVSEGVTRAGVLVMMTAGVSVRPLDGLDLNFEVLMPLTEDGSRIPVSGAVSFKLRVPEEP